MVRRSLLIVLVLVLLAGPACRSKASSADKPAAANPASAPNRPAAAPPASGAATRDDAQLVQPIK
jgi:hypothetical protein